MICISVLSAKIGSADLLVLQIRRPAESENRRGLCIHRGTTTDL